MKKLLLLLLFPLGLFAQVNRIFPGEYDCWTINPKDHRVYDVVQAGLNLSSLQPFPGAPMVAAGDGKGSASLHTAAFIGTDSFAYVWGDNTCNISGSWLGPSSSQIGWTKTGVPNARQIVAYANSGDPGGLGYGIAIVTYNGALVLLGNTQSGFRGDGTEGNQAEAGPYVVNSVRKTITKVAIGSFVYALCSDSTVMSWGGTRLQYYPTYTLGRGVDNPDPTRPGLMKFPEPIVDLVGGGNYTYFKGKSGATYGVAYNTRYLGLGANTMGQNTPFNLTKTLGLPGTPTQIAVGPQASYALMANGDLYAWGDNTQGAVGNGQEATFPNYVAPWGGGALWVDKPVKVNPAGVVFVKVWADIGDAFYGYAEDTNGNLYSWGRNKGFVLWNGKGTNNSTIQAQQPNLWDVLSPTKIAGFGVVATVPPPPANQPPVAILAAPASATLPADTLQLDGSGSSDPDGLIATYSIAEVAGPPSVLVQSGAKATVYATAAGAYTFRLTVVDNSGASTSTTQTVIVNSYPSCPVCPTQRSVTAVLVTVNGVTYPLPLSWLTITY